MLKVKDIKKALERMDDECFVLIMTMEDGRITHVNDYCNDRIPGIVCGEIETYSLDEDPSLQDIEFPNTWEKIQQGLPALILMQAQEDYVTQNRIKNI